MKKIYKRWWFWLAIIIIVIAIKGTSSSDNTTKNDESATSSSQNNKEKEAKTKVTYENFLKIGMDQSYEDACEVLGEGTETTSSDIGGITTKMYTWTGSGISNMNITVQNGVVTGKAQAGLKKNDANITLEKYNEINEGMSLEEVNSILGEGELTSQSKVMDIDSCIYSWINKDGTNCNVTFQSNVVTMKAQFNLK
ncbi:DUF3862 domain-containing protein [Clostridium sp. CTA-19]